MLTKLMQIPPEYYGVIAATLLLLAWSIDNVLKKKISSIADAMKNSESIQLRTDFEETVLHAISDIRDELITLNQAYGIGKAHEGDVPIEFTNLNSGRNIRVDQYINRFQALRLRAELTASAYQGTRLPHDIQEKIDRSVQFLWNLNTKLSERNEAIIKHIQGVMLGRKLDAVDPTPSAPKTMGKPQMILKRSIVYMTRFETSIRKHFMG